MDRLPVSGWTDDPRVGVLIGASSVGSGDGAIVAVISMTKGVGILVGTGTATGMLVVTTSVGSWDGTFLGTDTETGTVVATFSVGTRVGEFEGMDPADGASVGAASTQMSGGLRLKRQTSLWMYGRKKLTRE